MQKSKKVQPKLEVPGEAELFAGLQPRRLPLTVNFDVFQDIIRFLQKSGLPGADEQARYLGDGLKITEAAEVKPGDRVFVLSPSISFWTERVMAAKGAHVMMVEGDGARYELKKSWWMEMIPEIDSPEVRLLRKALESNGEFKRGVFPAAAPPKDSVDVFFMSAVLDSLIGNADELLAKSLETLKAGGRLVVGFYTPSGYDDERVLKVAAERGYGLERIPCEAVYGDANHAGGVFRLTRKPTR